VRARLEDDPYEFAARVGAFLRSRPVENNAVATVLEHAGDDALRAWVADDAGEVVAAAVRTPPRHLLVTTLADDRAADALAAELRRAGIKLPGVVGSEPGAGRVARALDPRARPGMAQAVYALSRVVAPVRPAPGCMRDARAADRALLVGWGRDFLMEAHAAGDPDEMIERRLGQGRLWVWEDGGATVGMVGTSPPVAGVVRIGPVWTPPEQRRRGYASALTAAVCTLALERGAKRCMLFADVGNPTSNAIYAAIGFERVGDAREWDLTP
jgi:predicted GNAT family acetyltransferase